MVTRALKSMDLSSRHTIRPQKDSFASFFRRRPMRCKRLLLLLFPLCHFSLSHLGFNRRLLPYFAFPRFFFLLAALEKLINGTNKQNETHKNGEATATKTWEKSRDCKARMVRNFLTKVARILAAFLSARSMTQSEDNLSYIITT